MKYLFNNISTIKPERISKNLTNELLQHINSTLYNPYQHGLCFNLLKNHDGRLNIYIHRKKATKIGKMILKNQDKNSIAKINEETIVLTFIRNEKVHKNLMYKK